MFNEAELHALKAGMRAYYKTLPPELDERRILEWAEDTRVNGALLEAVLEGKVCVGVRDGKVVFRITPKGERHLEKLLRRQKGVLRMGGVLHRHRHEDSATLVLARILKLTCSACLHALLGTVARTSKDKAEFEATLDKGARLAEEIVQVLRGAPRHQGLYALLLALAGTLDQMPDGLPPMRELIVGTEARGEPQ